MSSATTPTIGSTNFFLFDPVVVSVELYQLLTGSDVVVLVDRNRFYVTADFCEHRHDMTVDLRVVGRLMGAAVIPFLECPEKNEQCDDADDRQHEFLFVRSCCCLCRAVPAADRQ